MVRGTGHSAYITSTLKPFVLPDPGLLGRFQKSPKYQGDCTTACAPMCVYLLFCTLCLHMGCELPAAALALRWQTVRYTQSYRRRDKV